MGWFHLRRFGKLALRGWSASPIKTKISPLMARVACEGGMVSLLAFWLICGCFAPGIRKFLNLLVKSKVGILRRVILKFLEK